jgi:hypothetical protein
MFLCGNTSGQLDMAYQNNATNRGEIYLELPAQPQTFDPYPADGIMVFRALATLDLSEELWPFDTSHVPGQQSPPWASRSPRSRSATTSASPLPLSPTGNEGAANDGAGAITGAMIAFIVLACVFVIAAVVVLVCLIRGRVACFRGGEEPANKVSYF